MNTTSKTLWAAFAFIASICIFANIPSTVYAESDSFHDIGIACRQEVRVDTSTTFAEKMVLERQCTSQARIAAMNSLPAATPSSIQILHNQIRDCDAKYEAYQYLGAELFFYQEASNLARHCVIMYQSDEWSIQGEDRKDRLVDFIAQYLQDELDNSADLRKHNTDKSIQIANEKMTVINDIVT